jgi:hypothetical protein
MRKLSLMLTGLVASAMVLASSALAAPDPTITDVKTQLTTYFTDNLPTVIAAFVAVAVALWMIGVLTAKIGVRKPKSGN